MNYLTTHKKQLVILLVILPLIGLGVYLALNQTLLKSRASQGNVTFAPESITKKPGESFVVSVSVNPNGASAVGVSTEISFNSDLLDITPADIERGALGDLTEKVVEKNGSAGKVKISAVNFNAQQQNYHTPTATSTVIATLTFKAKNTTNGTPLTFDDILVVAPGNNQTISIDKGKNANIAVSGQGAPTVPTAVACSLSVSRTSGGLDDDFTFTLNSPALAGAGIPSGSELTWGGTNNGQAVPESSAGTSTSSPQVVGTFKGRDFGGAAQGTYTRSIQVKRGGTQICQTIPVSITVSNDGSPTAQLYYFTQAGATQETLRVKRATLSSAPIIQNGGVVDVKAVNISFPTGASQDNNSAIWVVKANSSGTAPEATTSWTCNSPNSTRDVSGVRYCGIGNPSIAADATTGRVSIRDWNPQQVGTYKIFVEAVDKNGKKCSGYQNAFGTPHPIVGFVPCDTGGNDALTLTVSSAAGGATSTLTAGVINSTQGESNSTATGSPGISFPAGKFLASAFVPNTSTDNVTGTGMYIVKVDPTTKIPVANPTWSCNVPSGVTIGGSSTTSPIINVTDTNVPASFRTRYCVIADGVSGLKQYGDIQSKAFSVSEVGTYIVFMDANAGTTANPTVLACTGAPWEAYPNKTRCQASGGDSVVVTVGPQATTSAAAIRGFIDQILADYGQSGGLNGDYNKDGKVDSLDFAFQLFKNK